MNPGTLRHRVQIQSLAGTANELGERNDTWVTVASRWASLEPGTGSESETAGQLKASSSTTMTIRYYSGLTTRHRVKFGSRIFGITGIQVDSEVKRFQKLTCTEHL